MMEIRTRSSMDQIIRRLEAIYRAARSAPYCDDDVRRNEDARVAEAIAGCLRRLRAIAAQSTDARPCVTDVTRRRLH